MSVSRLYKAEISMSIHTLQFLSPLLFFVTYSSFTHQKIQVNLSVACSFQSS